MRRLALAVPALAFLAACQPAPTDLTEEQKAEIAAEVNAINIEFFDAWRQADFDRGMSYYYDSPEFAFAYEGEVHYGYAEVEARFRPGMANVASQDITMTSSETMVLAPDVVCTMEAGTYSTTDTDGVTGPDGEFAVTSVWVRSNGEWKIHIGHESFQPPETE